MNNPTSGGKAREFEYSVEDIRAHVGGKSAYWSDRALNHLCDAYTALEQDLAKLKAQNSHVCPECGHDMVSMDASKYADHWNKKLKEKLDRTEAQNQRLREKTFLNERNALQEKLAIAREWWIDFCECEPTRTEFPNTVQVATRNVWDANPLFPDAIIHVIEFAEYERVLEENERLKRELANSKRS